MIIKLSRGQFLIGCAIIVFALLAFLQNSYFQGGQSFGIYFTGNGHGDQYTTDPFQQRLALQVESKLPPSCDFCGPEDLLCQKYGYDSAS